MAILDEIFGGQPLPAGQIDGQEAMLMDLLRRLASGDAQTLQNSSGMTPVIADHLAQIAQAAPVAPTPAPDAAPAAPTTDRLAGLSGVAASMLRSLPLRDATDSPTVAALPYQPPDASIVPEDIARRDAARPRPPAPAQDGHGGSVDALMQASMMPDQAAGRGTPARAPFAPASRPASPAAQAGVETSLGERLSALGRGYAQGGLVGAIGDMMQGGEGVQRNATYRMLVARGLPPEQARDVVRSPAILQQILPSLFGNSAPQIVNIPGPYGTQTSVYWDAQSRRFQPAEGLMPGAPPPAQAQPAAPAVAPPPVLGAQAPGGQPAPASPPALNLGGAAAPPAVPAPASGVAPTGPPPRGARPELTPDGQFVLGNAAPQVPTGFVQRIGPGGRGFLWTLDGRPALEGAHAAQERDQQRERRASEHGEQARQADSVSEVIQQARLLVGVPNFDNALSLGRQRFDVGIPTPWGTVGGNAMALPQGIGRMIDPQNPSWGALDGIRSVQRQLELLVARPLMRGQGAVSESERALLSEAIGQLPQASNAADFQFRLNAIERMMSAAMRNTPGGVTGAAAEPSRPTQAEIGALVGNGPYGPTYSEDGIIALARKYNVRPADMRNYVVGIINNSDPR